MSWNHGAQTVELEFPISRSLLMLKCAKRPVKMLSDDFQTPKINAVGRLKISRPPIYLITNLQVPIHFICSWWHIKGNRIVKFYPYLLVTKQDKNCRRMMKHAVSALENDSGAYR